MSLWKYANPAEFMRLSGPALPVLWLLAGLCLGGGLLWGFFLTPDDYQQGATVKILFVHVPSALMAINAWLMMLVASLIWFIRRHHVSALAARAAAPVGATMTVIALLTGAIWGEPMWGTWWAWDPRLTSFFILFLFYVGYIALWEAVDEPDPEAEAGQRPEPRQDRAGDAHELGRIGVSPERHRAFLVRVGAGFNQGRGVLTGG